MPPHPPPKLTTGELADLLTGVASGQLSVAEALANLNRHQPIADREAQPAALQDQTQVTLDLDRERRCGFPEVIYGDGKPAEMIVGIIKTQQAAGQPSFATRVDPVVAKKVAQLIPSVRFNPLAKTLSAVIKAADASEPKSSPEPSPLPDSSDTAATVPAHVAVITAGSTDAPVAEEAIETLHWMNIPYRSYSDIGVAGPARLLGAVPRLRQATAVIVIAGMEGALPAAVGGHLSVPVFAVPTSVGYGATLGGLTPLLGMLSSCASNVAVVNIDAGFKAAYLAGLVTRPHLG